MKVNPNTIKLEIWAGLCLSQSDAEIAKPLKVSPSTITLWRNKFNFKPADKFEYKFRAAYGQKAVEIFKQMNQDNHTLQEIGNFFGFSREYARQARNKLISLGYDIKQTAHTTKKN